MANLKSAIKRTRQEPKRRMRNRVVKSRMRTSVKRAQSAITAEDEGAAQAAVVAAISQIDRAAAKGVIHPNNAARRKSRLMKRLNAKWFTPSKRNRTLEQYQRLDTPDVYEDLMVVLDTLRSKGFKRLVVVELTRKELGVPVVRVIVPGMEVQAMDEERVGKRLRGG